MTQEQFVMKGIKNCWEAVVEASYFLKKNGVHEPKTSAHLLLQHLLGLNSTRYYLSLSDPFPNVLKKKWEEVVFRKCAGEPVQYITGQQYFYGLPLTVTSDVLIPRPETELLVEQVIALGDQLWPQGTPHVLDVGTGSGAVAIAIAFLRSGWKVSGIDISLPALQVAKHNAVANEVKVFFEQGDLLSNFMKKKVDIVVSNPPYIPAPDIAHLQTEVKDYEPHLALDGGVDGLALYRRMTKQLEQFVSLPKIVALEVGKGQANEVVSMLEPFAYWREIKVVTDLQGIERHVVATI